MRRKITEDLDKWKREGSKLPYMLVGARQVGKTYIVEDFCKTNYTNYIYINLEKEHLIRDIFEKSIDPEEIIKQISLLKNRDMMSDDTIVFFDEIQVSERAITSLKYFNESETSYDIVCAGSLLLVVLNRFKTSFPVGKVKKVILYPMDFEEFLWACEENMLAEEIRASFFKDKALFEAVHEKSLSLYKDYLFIGGMPASVLEYLNINRNLNRYDRTIKQNIIDGYIADMSKYTTSAEHMRIRKTYYSMPKQLGRDNKKFKYRLVDEKANKLYYETSIEWLLNSNLVTRCVLVDSPRIPLIAYEKTDYFKLYLNDVGLLVEMSNMTIFDVFSDKNLIFKGMLTENYVAQMLTSKDYNLNYWTSSNTAELDFILSIKGNIIPIEVKASNNTKSKSLNVYTERYTPRYAIKVSSKNFGFVNNIKSVPLYSVHLIKDLMDNDHSPLE